MTTIATQQQSIDSHMTKILPHILETPKASFSRTSVGVWTVDFQREPTKYVTATVTDVAPDIISVVVERNDNGNLTYGTYRGKVDILPQVLPADKEAFNNRWSQTEHAFKQTMPKAVTTAHNSGMLRAQ